jgi:uncharacterized protein YjdB
MDRLLTGITSIPLAAALISCGGDAAPPIEEITLESLTLSSAPARVVVDETVTLASTGRFSDGSEADLTAETTFSVQDLTALGQRGDNVFRALRAGTVEVTGTARGVSGTLTLAIDPAPLESLELRPPSVTVEVNETAELRAIGAFADGRREDVRMGLEWASSDPAVARVAAGEVTGVAPGAAEVTARSGDISAATRVTVRAPRLRSLEVGPALMDVPAGDERQLEAVGRLTSGATVSVTAQADWRSSDPSVVEVDPDRPGIILARGEGRATITAREADAGLEGSTTVSVAPAVLRAVTVTPTTASLPAGTITRFGAIGLYSDGSRADFTERVVWTSSDPGVMRVANQRPDQGLATAVAAGQATIRVAHEPTGLTSDASGGSAVVTVTPPRLESLSITPRTANVAAGLPQQFTATGSYSDGSSRDLSSQVTWSTSSPMIATVDGAGRATTLTQGTVTVSAVDPSNRVASGPLSATLTVDPAELVRMTLIPGRVQLVEGQSGELRASGTFTDGSVRDVSQSVGWRSSQPAVEVSPSGALSAVSAGTATITATGGRRRVTASAVVTVDALRLLRVQVTPGATNLPVGTEVQLSARGAYNDGALRDLNADVRWSTSAPAVVGLSRGPGLARALSAGTADVVAVEPASGLSGQARIAVTSTLTLRRLAVTVPSPSIVVGGTEQATALGTFSDGNTYAMTHTVTFRSSNPAVATVASATTSAGRVRGVATGTASISALDPATQIASATNPVVDVRASSVTKRWPGPTVSVDGTGNYGRTIGPVRFTTADFPSGARITDVNVTVDFLKTDGTCANPRTGAAFHNEINFRLRGPGSRRQILAPPRTWSGNTTITPVQITFDQSATAQPSGTPRSGTFRPRTGDLSRYNTTNPIGAWYLEAGDTAGADPLCVREYSVTIQAR